MSSPTLLRLIDEAIVPSVILIGAKLFGIIVVGSYLNLPLVEVFERKAVLTSKQFLDFNSYSTLIMILVYFFCFGFILFRGFKLHEKHLPPKTVQQLVKRNLTDLVVNSFKLYHQYFIWGLIALLTSVTLWIYAYYGLIYAWVATISILGSILFQWLLVIDIENDLGLAEFEGENHLEIKS